MVINLKEKLFDKIGGIEFIEPNKDESWYNKGVRETKARIVTFFNENLIPEVPQFIADWYEEHKDDFEFSVFNYLYTLDGQECSVFKKWLVDSKTEPFKVLVNMHQFGYKVKKERRYTVKIKGKIEENFLVYGRGIKRYFFARDYSDGSRRGEHTRKELEEDGFGGVFNNPMFEVEEMME